VNFAQRLGQEIHEVEIDAEEEDHVIVIEITTVVMMLNHPSRSFHEQNPVKVLPLFD